MDYSMVCKLIDCGIVVNTVEYFVERQSCSTIYHVFVCYGSIGEEMSLECFRKIIFASLILLLTISLHSFVVAHTDEKIFNGTHLKF